MIQKSCFFVALVALILLPASVTEEEQNWMTFMREEEKLARDTYLYLYAKWKMPIFNNISSAE